MAEEKKDNIKHKISIVGGGASAFYTLNEIVSLLDKDEIKKSGLVIPSNIEIEIFDKSPAKGDYPIDFTGLAWTPENLLPVHMLNIYLKGRDYFDDFLKMQIAHDPSIEPFIRSRQGKYGETSRDLYSAYINLAGMAAVNTLREDGVKVTLRPATEVTGLTKAGKGYRLSTAAGETSDTDFVVLATGHWQGNAKDREGLYNSPWPAPKFQHENLNQPVAVMGTSLSGVDAILSLAYYAGDFERDKNDKLIFVPHERNKNFEVHAYSPHGFLPNVLGAVKEDKNDYKSNEALIETRSHPLYKEELADMDATYRNLRDYFLLKHSDYATTEQGKALAGCDTIKQLIDTLNDYYSAQDPQELLRSQIGEMKKSLEKNQTPAIQYFVRSNSQVLEAANMMSFAEDQDYFRQEVRTMFNKHAYGMVMQNAEQMLALMEAGCLKLHALGKESSVGAAQGTKGADIHYTDRDGMRRDEHYNVVVRAQGDEPGKLKYSSPLLKGLFESGMAKTHIMPFRDQEAAKRAHDIQDKNAKDPEIIFRDGIYWKDFGGIALGKNRQLHNGQDVQSRIYGLGPLHYLQTPLLQGIAPIKKSSFMICGDIIANISAERMLAGANAKYTAVQPEETMPEEKPAPPQEEKITEPKDICFYTVDHTQVLYIVEHMPERMKQELIKDRILSKASVPRDNIHFVEERFVTDAMRNGLDTKNPIRGVSM